MIIKVFIIKHGIIFSLVLCNTSILPGTAKEVNLI